MGWWGHGVMDGDGPSDAAYMIKVRAFGGTNKELGEVLTNEFEDLKFAEKLTAEDQAVLKAHVLGNVDLICKGAVNDARRGWSYGGPDELIAAAYELVETYGVKTLPAAMVERLEVAFVHADRDASDFDSPRARRNVLRRARKIIQKAMR